MRLEPLLDALPMEDVKTRERCQFFTFFVLALADSTLYLVFCYFFALLVVFGEFVSR